MNVHPAFIVQLERIGILSIDQDIIYEYKDAVLAAIASAVSQPSGDIVIIKQILGQNLLSSDVFESFTGTHSIVYAMPLTFDEIYNRRLRDVEAFAHFCSFIICGNLLLRFWNKFFIVAFEAAC